MRFGGHESFAVREGWLSRGLELLANQPELLVDQHAEDHLGVGRNMAKAIRHWLVAAGLASASTATVDHFAFTPFGKQIYKSDPHLLDLGTWWMLHVNLVRNKESAFAVQSRIRCTWCGNPRQDRAHQERRVRRWCRRMTHRLSVTSSRVSNLILAATPDSSSVPAPH